eukprot:GEMP01012482.1.p1 GENE.GEMP01012482.1~~GEMP01012482.1.p1  ORF type:complete len:368 (-),score=81.21 GEMP01012482.1:2011-3114(-)
MSRAGRRKGECKVDTTENDQQEQTQPKNGAILTKKVSTAVQAISGILSNEKYEVPCRQMLLVMLESASRDPLPDDLINSSWKGNIIDGMLGKTLKNVGAKLENRAMEMSHKVADSDNIKLNHEKTTQMCQEELDALQSPIEECMQKCESLRTAVKAAVETSDAAAAELQAEIERHEKDLKRQALTKKTQGCLEKLDTTELTSKEIRRNLLPIELLFNELDHGLSIIGAIPEAFLSPRDARREFDTMVVDFVTRKIEEESLRVNEEISDHEARLATCQAQVTATVEALSNASSSLAEMENTLEELSAQEDRLIKTKEDAEKQIKNHDKNVSQWKKAAVETRNTWEDFQVTVLTSFEFLKNRSPESMGA